MQEDLAHAASLEASSVQGGSRFRHEELQDATTQIRLLLIKPDRETASLELELTTWNFEDAPAYYAISYAWGETQENTLRINGLPVSVRRNCHYALWQVRRLYPGIHIWIDSICIDQSNLREKGHQVTMMKDIYVKASWVLACIGPHENGSDMILRAVDRLIPTHDQSCPPTQLPKTLRQAWDTLAREFSREDRRDLGEALIAFYKRPYFARLWIHQEIAAADRSVQFLCGQDIFSWAMFRLVVSFAWRPDRIALGLPIEIWRDFFGLDEPPRTAAWTVTVVGLGGGDLVSTLALTKDCGYTVPQDRFFAILSLVRWGSRGCPIVADYTRSVHSLSVDLLVHKAYDYITTVFNEERIRQYLDALALHATQAEIDTFRRPRLHLSRERQEADQDGLLYLAQRTAFGPLYPTDMARLATNEAGHLTMSISASSAVNKLNIKSGNRRAPDRRN